MTAQNSMAVASGSDDRSRVRFDLLTLLALAVGLFFACTRHGIGILPDSTRYMQLVSTPYDAPLYPWLLEAGALAGFELTQAALGIGLVLFVLNTYLIFRLFDRALPRQPWFVMGGSLLIVANSRFIWVNTIAMSEALFLALMLLTVTFFLTYLERSDRRSLAAASVSLGLAMLARFVAPALGATLAAVTLCANSARPMRARILDVSVLFVVSSGIFLSWAILSKLALGRAVGREIWFYGNPDAELWLSGLSVLSSFLVPSQVPFGVRMVMLSVVLLGAALIVARAVVRNWLARRPARQDELILIFGLHAVFYVLFVIASVLIEANLQLNSRYALILYVSLVFVFVVAAANHVRGGRAGKTAAWLIASTLAIFLTATMLRGALYTQEAFADGVGYQSRTWRASPIVAAVASLPADAKIFTNASDPLNFLTGRRTEWIPAHSDRRTGLPGPEGTFEEQLQAFQRAMDEQATYAVFVDAIDWRFFLASEEELVSRARLKLIRAEADGRIYQSRGAGAE